MTLQAGAFKLDITPPLGVSLAGFYEDMRAEDVHDPLCVHALVLSHSGTGAAILSLDLLGIPPDLNARMLDRITALTGIPQANITITATHTHAGPAVDPGLLEGMCHVSPCYLDQLVEKTASAVRLAQLRLRPAYLHAGHGENAEFVHNRRLRRPDGSIVMNWIDPRHLRDTVSGGEVDPELGIFQLSGEDGEAIALLVNYANHNNAFPDPVSGGSAVSADYAGVLRRELAAGFPPETVILFLPGCAGNINWVDHTRIPYHVPGLAERIGRSLAETVRAALPTLEAIPVPWLRCRQRTLAVPERPSRPYDTQVDFTFGPPEEARHFFAAYQSAKEAAEGKPLGTHPVNLNVIRLGPQAVLCTNPAELFTEFGLEIKRRSSATHTLVAELTNGSIGYVPTRAAFAEGGYEVRKISGASVLAVDAGDSIVSNLLEMIAETGG